MTKSIGETMAEWRKYFVMMLGDKENLLSGVDTIKIDNTDNNRTIYNLLPAVHRRYDVEYKADNTILSSEMRVSPAAKEMIDSIGQDIIASIKEADQAWAAPTTMAIMKEFANELSSNFGDDAADTIRRMNKLMDEIAAEEERLRVNGEDNDSRDAAKSSK